MRLQQMRMRGGDADTEMFSANGVGDLIEQFALVRLGEKSLRFGASSPSSVKRIPPKINCYRPVIKGGKIRPTSR